MKGKRLTTLLTLSVFVVIFLCIPALADDVGDCSSDKKVMYDGKCMMDADGDGVPDEIEDAIAPLFGINHSTLPYVATFVSSSGRYMTLFIQLPGLELKNVAAIESADGTPLSVQGAQAAPFGFIQFEVSGVTAGDPGTVSLILHDYQVDPNDFQMIRYGSRSCPIDLDNAEYYDPVTPMSIVPVGTWLTLPLIDFFPLEAGCEITDTIPYIGAPTILSHLDADGDDVLVFEDICPDDPDNDIDGDGICGNVDNCPAVSNFNQVDADFNGTGDMCETGDETSFYSVLGDNSWRSFRDQDLWLFNATAGENVVITVQADPEGDGIGKVINLILFSKTRGARLLRLDFSALDPQNKIEAQIPKDGTYGVVVGSGFGWWKRRYYKGTYRLTIKASPETRDSFRATSWVENWWH